MVKFLLDTSAALIESITGQVHDVEGIHDRPRSGEFFKGCAFEPGESIHRDDLNALAPRVRLGGQPGFEDPLGATRDHVQEPGGTAAIVDGCQIQDDGDVPVPIRGVAPHVFIHANDTHPFTPSWIIDQQTRPFSQDSSVRGSSRTRPGPGRRAPVSHDEQPRPSAPAHRCARELGTRIGRWTHVLTPYVSILWAPIAAHAHMQDRGTPPTGLMRQAPDHRATRNALAPTASTPPVLTSNTARQQIMVWLNVLTRHLQPQAIQASERAQIRTIKDSIGHVEVSQMDGVAISIIGRPRPLPGHDTPNPAHNTYTLKCDDPVKAAQGYEFLGGMRRMTTIQALRTLSSILWLRRYDLSSSKLPGPVRGNSEASWIDKWIG